MLKKEIKHSFGWGDPSGVRAKFLSVYPEFNLNWIDAQEVKYGLHEGEEDLRLALKDLFSKHGYFKHWLITSGCTQAIGAAIHGLRKIHTRSVFTRSLYFPFYPKIVSLYGLEHITNPNLVDDSDIRLIDVPSNPMGLTDRPNIDGYSKVIIDGAYLSETYVSLKADFSAYDCLVGSLGKITGFTGLRLGFLATNNEDLYNKAYDWVCYGSIGTSVIGQSKIAKAIADKPRWEMFQAVSRANIDANRYEISRLDHLFDGQLPPQNGMFAFFMADKKAIKKLELAQVGYVAGIDCGADYLSIRLNMGKTVEETRSMVDAVLKADGKKIKLRLL